MHRPRADISIPLCAMHTPMRHLSSFTKRVLRFLVAMLLMMHGASYAAVFSPEMERFGECSQVMTVRAVELKERAASRDLYYMRVRPWGDSTDERMLRSQRMQGPVRWASVRAKWPFSVRTA